MVYTSAGSKFYIHEPAAGNNPAALDALAGWVEVGEVENISDLGETFDAVSRTFFQNGPRAEWVKTITTGQRVELVVGRVVGDAGQVLLRLASKSRESYLLKIELDDRLVESHQGSRIIFRGLVLSTTTIVGDASSVTRIAATIQINSEVWELPTGPV